MKQTLDSFENTNKNYNNKIKNKNHNDKNLKRLSDEIVHSLKLPYRDDLGVNLIKLIKTSSKMSLPKKHNFSIILARIKINSQFNFKDDNNKQYKYDLVYFSRCPSLYCTYSYIGETTRRLNKRAMDHAGRDTKFHIIRHYLNSNHETVNIENFKILDIGYNNNTYKRKTSKVFFVNPYRLSLNVHDNSVPTLQLFNWF